MIYLPNEIINIILSYVERPKHSKIIKYLIEDCYKEDYNPLTAYDYHDNYCFEYSFCEWYYLYRRQFRLGGLSKWQFKYGKKNNYKHTHEKLFIGHDKLEVSWF